MRQRFKLLRRDDGQALVELAFVLPLLLLFVFGIIEFGLALNQANSDTDLANIAARTVAVLGSKTSETCNGTSYTDLQSWTQCEARVTGSPVPNKVCVIDTANSSTYTAGDPVMVKVTTDFKWLSLLTGGSGYIGKVVNPTSAISSSATMRLEQAPKNGTSTFLSPTCS